MERLATIVALMIFGPVILGAMAQAVAPAVGAFFTNLFWFLVLVGACCGAFVLFRKYSEHAEREAQLQREHQELDDLYQRVVGEHKRIWDEQYEFDRTITEHQRALDEELHAITGSRNMGSETP